jgi:hypothetical protein
MAGASYGGYGETHGEGFLVKGAQIRSVFSGLRVQQSGSDCVK